MIKSGIELTSNFEFTIWTGLPTSLFPTVHRPYDHQTSASFHQTMVSHQVTKVHHPKPACMLKSESNRDTKPIAMFYFASSLTPFGIRVCLWSLQILGNRRYSNLQLHVCHILLYRLDCMILYIYNIYVIYRLICIYIYK